MAHKTTQAHAAEVVVVHAGTQGAIAWIRQRDITRSVPNLRHIASR